MRLVINTVGNVFPTILSGYYKFGCKTLLAENYGTTGGA